MAQLSSNSGLGFYTTLNTGSLSATDLDTVPSDVKSGTDTVYIEGVSISVILNEDGTQTFFLNITFVATDSTDTGVVSKRWTQNVDTGDLTELDFINFMNDLQQFGQVDESESGLLYTDGTKGTSDFS